MFTAAEAAEYLEVSIATFRRYVRDQKITVASAIGTTHLYSLEALRALKNALQIIFLNLFFSYGGRGVMSDASS